MISQWMQVKDHIHFVVVSQTIGNTCIHPRQRHSDAEAVALCCCHSQW